MRVSPCDFRSILLLQFLTLNHQAEKSDGWDTDPFKLVIDETTGRLIGRGSSDDKGPVLGWLNVLDAHKALDLSLPVNLRFCFEGMEESGSEGLDDMIKAEVKKGKEGWFDGVDCVCIVSTAMFSYFASPYIQQ
jgi:Cys-Gly metallodipeptidase DUG1